MPRYKDSDFNTFFVQGDLDSLLPPDSVARSLRFALETLDFSAFDTLYSNDGPGASAIDPRSLMGVWILALLRGVTSSVVLAALCKTDIEFRWMLRDVGVEKSTLCDFRKQRLAQMQELSLEVLAALGHGGLLPARKLGLDGTVLPAAASCRRCKTRQQLEKKRERLRLSIAQSLEGFDGQGESAPRQRKLQEHQTQVEAALARMDELGLKKEKDRLTLTEEDAQFMKMKDGRFAPGRNAQVVSDLESGVIVHAQIIGAGGDGGQLLPQLTQAQEVLQQVAQRGHGPEQCGASLTEISADAAYHDTLQLVAIVESGITAHVPKPGDRNAESSEARDQFHARHFTYDQSSDTMLCPTGKTLRPRKLSKHQSAMTYQAKASDCNTCPFKTSCCPQAQYGRSVNRPLYQNEMNTIAQHLKTHEGKQTAAQHRTCVEGNMGRLKEKLYWRRCRCWGILGAQAELTMRQIANNLMLLSGIWKPLVMKTT